jgi:hypothetical protein
MKNASKLFVFIILILFGACTKNNNITDLMPESDLKNIEKNKIIKKWKLNALVNISDQQKYLGAILELKGDGNFVITSNNGTTKQGSWNTENNYLVLSSTLFNNGGDPKYKILILNDNELSLQEYYTPGGKTAYLEYTFVISS